MTSQYDDINVDALEELLNKITELQLLEHDHFQQSNVGHLILT